MANDLMRARLQTIESEHKVVHAVDHREFLAIFTTDDVAHIWDDGTVTWESASVQGRTGWSV